MACDLTIEQLKDAKSILKGTIYDAIADFEKMTGYTPKSISIPMIETTTLKDTAEGNRYYMLDHISIDIDL